MTVERINEDKIAIIITEDEQKIIAKAEQLMNELSSELNLNSDEASVLQGLISLKRNSFGMIEEYCDLKYSN